MTLETIQQRVREGHYLIKSHAAVHALKEGFDRKHLVEAVLNGTVIEDYAETKRALLCGRIMLSNDIQAYLHVVCEYADPFYVEFVTAYIPDEQEWQKPPFKRRTRKS